MFLFFAVKAELFLIFPFSEAGHVLNLFLFFEKFEPQRSHKHGSYKKQSVQFKQQNKIQKQYSTENL